MALSGARLPDDVETLKRLLIGRDELIEKLKAEIARLRRRRFGRFSERSEVPPHQLPLALDELQVTSAPTSVQRTVALEQATQAQPKPRELRRSPRSFSEHLPRETIVHAPSCCTCPDCRAAMRALGEDISEQLDYEPGYFKVIRHVRPKFSCVHCAQVLQMPAPSRPSNPPPYHTMGRRPWRCSGADRRSASRSAYATNSETSNSAGVNAAAE